MLLLITCISCKKETIDFTYSPSQPKAGEKVTFLNTSSVGEEWLWKFGDGDMTGSKSPTHTYKAPGTYLVSLKIDDKESRTISHSITIVDTVPCFLSDHDTLSIRAFEDVTFMAQVFNPNSDDIICYWTAEPACTAVIDSTDKKWKVYFTRSGKVDITMNLTLNDVTTVLTRSYTVEDKPTTALLMMDKKQQMTRQRVFVNPARSEEITPLTYSEGQSILQSMQDTLQTVNGYTYRLSELQTIVPEMIGFRIAYGKIYYRTDAGLYISDVMGNYINTICPEPVGAVFTDTYTGANRLYWATSDGVYYMPLVDHPMNQFDIEKIDLLNEQADVIRLAVDIVARLR